MSVFDNKYAKPTSDGIALFSTVHPPGFWKKLKKALPGLIKKLNERRHD